jgi:antitoxin ParD1/3/4
MALDRINTRLPEELANHVASVVGPRFETSSEYIRDLIRRDMENSEAYQTHNAIIEGYQDIAAGRYFKSTGNFKKDMKILDKKEAEGWQ